MSLHLIRSGIVAGREIIPTSALESLELRIEPEIASMRLLGEEDVTLHDQRRVARGAGVALLHQAGSSKGFLACRQAPPDLGGIWLQRGETWGLWSSRMQR